MSKDGTDEVDSESDGRDDSDVTVERETQFLQLFTVFQQLPDQNR